MSSMLTAVRVLVFASALVQAFDAGVWHTGNNREWPKSYAGYHAVQADHNYHHHPPTQRHRPRVVGTGQADCLSPGASKTCECSADGTSVICRSTTIYLLQNDIPCPQNIRQLTLISPQFGSPCLTRENMTSFPNLQSLTITGSNLELLARDVFRSQRFLELIDLHSNLRLSSVDPEAFAYLSNLTHLDLSGNERLGNLPPRVFSKTPQLRSLNLSWTSMSKLPLLSSNIRVLDISHNRIVSLASDLVPQFCKLEQVHLADNPWCCSRQTRWISMFIRIVGDRGVVRDMPVCHGPDQLYGWPISQVSADRMNNYRHCKGSHGGDDINTCASLYALFKDAMPELPSVPDDRILYDNRIYDDSKLKPLTELERGQVHHAQQENEEKTTSSEQWREWRLGHHHHHHHDPSPSPPDQGIDGTQRLCLAAFVGDCTSGNIVVGTVAAVGGAVLVGLVVLLARCFHCRRSTRMSRAPLPAS